MIHIRDNEFGVEDLDPGQVVDGSLDLQRVSQLHHGRSLLRLEKLDLHQQATERFFIKMLILVSESID